MNLGKQLLKIRKDNKMSQEDFAELFNVTRQTISSWENSKSYPDIETLVKISDQFHISLDILLKGDTEMIENIDRSIKGSSKYKKILLVISIIIGIFILTFGGYVIKYHFTKNRLETSFTIALQENNFKKNRDGYYSMTYTDNIEFGAPNQKMPPLLDFDLDFNVRDLYCDIKMEDGKYMSGLWTEYNEYNFTIYDKNNIVIGSSSNLKSNKNNIEKLSEELNYDKTELQKIIEKGNSLYKEFYK